MRRWLFLAGLALGIALPLSADTIVLKNGRKIHADNVVEESGKVTFDTPAGKLSLPMSLVERIDRGPSGQTFTSGSPATEDLTTAAPPPLERVAGYDEVTQATFHDGSIDREYIASLESRAQGGSPEAIAQLVVAHYVAAQFELKQGNPGRAIAHYRRALSFAPDNSDLLLNAAYLHLRQNEYTAALNYLDRARRVAPDSPDVAKLAGWAYYGSNRLDRAIAAWKRALELHPDEEVARALEKAERDQAVEQGFRQGLTAHFQLRYNGTAAPQLAREVLRKLEDHFTALTNELSFTPAEQIAVVLYTDQQFADITRAPSWAGAVNDGRLRIPVQGLTSMTPELSRILKHELAHSFIQQKTRGRCPIWLHEGIAQWVEGARSDRLAQALVAAYDQNGGGALPLLEDSWMNLRGNAASFAYAWSLATAEAIIATGGTGDVERLLDRLTSAPSTSAALRDVLHSDYPDLERQTIDYLRRKYLR